MPTLQEHFGFRTYKTQEINELKVQINELITMKEKNWPKGKANGHEQKKLLQDTNELINFSTSMCNYMQTIKARTMEMEAGKDAISSDIVKHSTTALRACRIILDKQETVSRKIEAYNSLDSVVNKLLEPTPYENRWTTRLQKCISSLISSLKALIGMETRLSQEGSTHGREGIPAIQRISSAFKEKYTAMITETRKSVGSKSDTEITDNVSDTQSKSSTPRIK